MAKNQVICIKCNTPTARNSEVISKISGPIGIYKANKGRGKIDGIFKFTVDQ